MTHVTEEQLVAYALDDAERPTRAARSIRTSRCAASAARRSRNCGVCWMAASELDVPERPADYGADGVGTPGAAAARSHTRHVSCQWRPWLAAAAVLLLTVGAFLIGRWSRPGADARAGRGGPSNRQRAASASASCWRRFPITSIAPSEGWSSSSTPTRAARSTSPPNRRGLATCSMRIASIDSRRAGRRRRRSSACWASSSRSCSTSSTAPAGCRPTNFNPLRSRIDDRSLVFKVRVTGADVRARQRALIHSGEKTS